MPRHHPTQYVRSSLTVDNGWKSVLGLTVRRFQKLWDQIETFACVMGPKLQQKSYGTKLIPLPKLWDQMCTLANILINYILE